MKTFDVVVIGSGTIGMLTAWMCLRQGKTVALIDRQSLTTTTITQDTPFDVRVSAITPHSKRYLEQLDIWQQLVRTTPYQKVYVADAHTQETIVLPEKTHPQNPVGYIVEQSVLQHALLNTLQQAGCVFYFGTTPEALILEKDHNILYLPDRVTLSTELCIAADGARSWVRTQCNIPCDHYDYQQTAMIATLRTEHPHHHTARQCFLSTGPIAFLPLPDPHSVSLVWTLPKTMAQNLQKHPENIATQITEAFSILGAITLNDQPHFLPLHRQQAHCYVQQRVVLVGDAAHVVHPLAGWGLNLGINDVEALDKTLAHHSMLTQQSLRQWERKQRAYHAFHMKLIDSVIWMFNTLPASIRAIGFQSINRVKLLRRYILKIASEV